MSHKGLPDWSQPLAGPGGTLFVAHDDPRRVFAPPISLGVAGEPGGAPAFALELIPFIGGAEGPVTLGLLTIRFVGRFLLAERQEALFATFPEAKAEPLPPRGGFLRFEAAEALDVPDDLLAPKPLFWAGAGSLTFATQLGAAATALVNRSILQGLATVTAVAEVEAEGVARRVPASALFDPAALAARLQAAASGGDDGWRPEDLAAAIADCGDAEVISITGPASDADRIAAAEATAERIIGRYGRLAPAGDPARGPVFVLDYAAMPAGRMDWDLRETVIVPRGFVLFSDPLETAREAVASGFALVRQALAAPVATGLHVLSLFPNLPAKRVGVLMLSTEVRVPPFLPDRPQAVVASVRFGEGQVSATLPIRLAPTEPLAFDYQTMAFVVGNGGAERLTGPVLRHASPHLTVPPDSFPVRFVRLEATARLLEAARVSVECTGLRGAAAWSAKAELAPGTPELAVAVPRDVGEGAITVTATAPDGGRVRRIEGLPLEDSLLDMSSFPTAGPARVEIACDFDDGATLAAIECAPEDRLGDAEAIGLVRLTPAASRREWRWLVTNPLRDGFHWRWFGRPGEPAAPWSERIDPAAGPLAIRSSARITGSGLMEDAR
jgi:hypothetical protein